MAVGVAFAMVWALAAPVGRHGRALSWQGLIAPAEAASAKAEAKAKLQQGAKLLQEGEFAQALAQFKDAYELVPSPKIFFNFGIAYAGLGRYSEALESFEKFTAEATDASPANLAEARQQIDSLTGKVEKVTVTSDRDGASVSIDGRSYGLTPLAHPIYVDPGSHQLIVQDDRPLLENFTAFAGKEATLVMRFKVPEEPSGGAASGGAGPTQPDLTAGPTTGTSGADEEANNEARRKLHRRLRRASLIGAGVGVAAGVTGLILHTIGTNKYDAIVSDAAATPPRDYNPSNGNYSTFETAGVGLIVGGAALVGASAITYLLNRDRVPVEKGVAVSLSAGPTGRFGLLLSGSY